MYRLRGDARNSAVAISRNGWVGPRSYGPAFAHVPVSGFPLRSNPETRAFIWEVARLQGNLTLRSFGLLCISITLGSFAQVFLKMGLHGHKLADPGSIVRTVLHIATAMLQPWVLRG